MTPVGGFIPSAADMTNLVAGIRPWAGQDGGAILVQSMPNGFFPTAQIGPGIDKRSRSNTCPAKADLKKYSVQIVPTSIDYKNNIRWAEDCIH